MMNIKRSADLINVHQLRLIDLGDVDVMFSSDIEPAL